MNLEFSFHDCVALRYFIPLVKEASSRGHKSLFNVKPGWKYNGSSHEINKKQITNLMSKYNIQEGSKGDIQVVIEGSELIRNSKMTCYSLTVMLDYISHYYRYIDDVDYVVFPSRWFVDMLKDTFNKPQRSWHEGAQKCLDANIETNSKNLYLGSPKYDVDFDREKICNRHGIDKDQRYVLILYPRPETLGMIDIDKICNSIYSMGRIPILKSRGKHPFLKHHVERYLHTYDMWYPATTLELMYIADEVIGTNTSSIKEAVMMNTPMTNVCAHDYQILSELYEPNAKEKYLYSGNTSKRILDHMEENA